MGEGQGAALLINVLAGARRFLPRVMTLGESLGLFSMLSYCVTQSFRILVCVGRMRRGAQM